MYLLVYERVLACVVDFRGFHGRSTDGPSVVRSVCVGTATATFSPAPFVEYSCGVSNCSYILEVFRVRVYMYSYAGRSHRGGAPSRRGCGVGRRAERRMGGGGCQDGTRERRRDVMGRRFCSLSRSTEGQDSGAGMVPMSNGWNCGVLWTHAHS